MSSEEGLSGEVSPWVMSSFIFYSTLLLIKLMSNILLVAITRMRTGILGNPEDAKFAKGKEVKINTQHPLLTRVQRMHQNDLENIIPFFMLSFLLTMVWYSPYKRALWHFRVFFGARMLTSFCHYFEIQPLRSIFFMIAMGANLSMVGHILFKVGPTLTYF